MTHKYKITHFINIDYTKIILNVSYIGSFAENCAKLEESFNFSSFRVEVDVVDARSGGKAGHLGDFAHHWDHEPSANRCEDSVDFEGKAGRSAFHCWVAGQ